MKILYIHQYFKTPNEPGGTRSYWISRELISRGHDVIMLTTRPNQSCEREELVLDGLRVVSFSVPYQQSMGIWQRLRAFFDFMLRATKEGMKYQDVDLVIATSTPLTVGYPALRIKHALKIPYVFEVRDLWPEVPIQMGALENPLLQRIARWFERKIYVNANHVVTLSPGMQKGVTKYIPQDRTSMIPNMAKIHEFWPREINMAFVEELGLHPASFKVIHFGSLGLANGAEYIIEAARAMVNNADVEFIFLGGGSTEKMLKEKCRELKLENVKFLGKYPMDLTSEIVNFCDVSVVTFKDLPVLYTNSPNKFFDSLSAGKPIIVNSPGWTKDIVEKHSCGFFVNPSKPEELVERILFLKQNPAITAEMGAKSRWLAENQYDKSILCRQFANVVENCLNNP